nr:family 10 glycosylhydrolase [Fictibacillus macauensis]
MKVLPEAQRELRASWIATVQNIDWPSKPGLPIDAQKKEFTLLLDQQKNIGMNAIVMQIKPVADAFYPSKYGLWSQYLTGVQGQHPGYDPLAFMVKEAHKRNMEFHAWFNPYRVTMPLGKKAEKSDVYSLPSNHPARQHPDWVVPYGQQLYFNPGLPSVQKFVTAGIMEVVKHYDIDAVHLDDYFYPYKIEGVAFPDEDTYAKYGKKQFSTIGDWRRNNVNELVKNIHTSIHSVKKHVKFGISPFGVWRNKAKDPTGSDTAAGVTNYDDLYADTRTWINNGYLDYITPQLYWNIGLPVADYSKLVDWWSKEVKNKKVHLYIGQADYKINTVSNGVNNWFDPNELPNQILLNRTYKEIKGSMHFSATNVRDNPLGIADRLQHDLYRAPAIIPSMSWLSMKAPQPPTLRHVLAKSKHVFLHISNNKNTNDTVSYAVYRYKHTEKNKRTKGVLLATLRNKKTLQTFYDYSVKKGTTYTYAVTAINRNHHESTPSPGVTVTVN